eukprot:Filipodium_phascolosomae@DN3874_c0_g1_i1.p1
MAGFRWQIFSLLYCLLVVQVMLPSLIRADPAEKLESPLLQDSCLYSVLPVTDLKNAEPETCKGENLNCAGFWGDTWPRALDETGRNQLATFGIQNDARGQYFFMSGCVKFNNTAEMLASDDLAIQLVWNPSAEGMDKVVTSRDCVVLKPVEENESYFFRDTLSGLEASWWTAVACVCRSNSSASCDSEAFNEMFQTSLKEANVGNVAVNTTIVGSDGITSVVVDSTGETEAPATVLPPPRPTASTGSILPTVPPDFDWQKEWPKYMKKSQGRNLGGGEGAAGAPKAPHLYFYLVLVLLPLGTN